MVIKKKVSSSFLYLIKIFYWHLSRQGWWICTWLPDSWKLSALPAPPPDQWIQVSWSPDCRGQEDLGNQIFFNRIGVPRGLHFCSGQAQKILLTLVWIWVCGWQPQTLCFPESVSYFYFYYSFILIYCSIDSWYSTVLWRTVSKHPISDLEMEVFCHEMNSNADISMPETPFFKLIKIMDKLVQNDFGVFDNWIGSLLVPELSLYLPPSTSTLQKLW